MLALVAALISSGRSSQGCADFDREGCHARAALPGFCQRDWGATHCCATCSALADDPAPAVNGCQVPRQSCVSWVCDDSDGRATRPKATLPPGASCHVVAKWTVACQRCGVVDATTCAPFTDTLRTCRSDGTWSGAEPACRRFCDDTYTPPVDELPRMDWDALAAAQEPSEGVAAPLVVVPISAPPHGSFLQSKKVDHYMSHRIDVFGQWLVMFTPKCSKKFGAGPSLHVANQYAQWLDWQGTGTPNNPKVWAALKNYNVTMVMFETDGTHTMRKFEDKYPFDEDGPHGGLPVASAKEWMRPHDVECDETPHADPKDNSTYDNAYCEVSQQIFNLGYRAVWPETFMDKKGSLVANAMDQIIGDCGHAYDHTFKYPDCTGKFHYSDKTCEYDCLVSEFEWWSLTTILGGQDGTSGAPPGSGAGPRCKDISDEWESCTKVELMTNCPAIVHIMTDPQYGIPTKLPWGQYQPNATGV